MQSIINDHTLFQHSKINTDETDSTTRNYSNGQEDHNSIETYSQNNNNHCMPNNTSSHAEVKEVEFPSYCTLIYYNEGKDEHIMPLNSPSLPFLRVDPESGNDVKISHRKKLWRSFRSLLCIFRPSKKC